MALMNITWQSLYRRVKGSPTLSLNVFLPYNAIYRFNSINKMKSKKKFIYGIHAI